MIELNILQQRALDKKNAERGEAVFIAQAQHAWRTHGQSRMPAASALTDAALHEWIKLTYASCLHRAIPDRPLTLEFTFAILRAVHLGAGRSFISELAAYFFDRAPDYRGSLDWIGTMLGQLHVQQVQATTVGAHA